MQYKISHWFLQRHETEKNEAFFYIFCYPPLVLVTISFSHGSPFKELSTLAKTHF